MYSKFKANTYLSQHYHWFLSVFQYTRYWVQELLFSVYNSLPQHTMFSVTIYITVATHTPMRVSSSYARSGASQSTRLAVGMRGVPSDGLTAGFNALAHNQIVHPILSLSTLHKTDTCRSVVGSVMSSVGYCSSEEPLPPLILSEQPQFWLKH